MTQTTFSATATRVASEASDFARARRSMAGGVSSPVRAGTAVGGAPPVIARARGSRIFDAEDREYIDYLCAYGPVLLGHADERIAAAVDRACRQGAVLGGTHSEEIRLAERLGEAMPSMQRVRFVSTGTEACASAVRVARAFTGRLKIVRFAGNYHGHSDAMIFNAGAASNSRADARAGITQGVAGDVIALPYDDLQTLGAALSREGDRVAAVILEPVVGNMGLVLPSDGYLSGVRSLATRHGALLIFDEVITGFRLGLGGAQELFGVKPDVTCVGKVLGGGLPIAAFGGRADVMAVLAPDGHVFQGGTFSGNPVCVAAAHALLDAIESDPLFYNRLSAKGSRLARGARHALADAGLDFPVVQLGSIVDFMFRHGGAHRTFDEAKQADARSYARYYWAMLERGVFLPPSQMEVMFLTAAHSDEDIDRTVDAMRNALLALAEGADASRP
ncbi:MAG TPA: glutamate-1-semialdehyde 2,1-aminomutase [Candidatus Eremiobacteraceae bacterium]|nr:glutamate-1-semialdehyde 2,1-aminomutase [Candidatus Eremiobacteraceae bacterium]